MPVGVGAEGLLHRLGERADLPDAIHLRQHRQHRLIEAAADDLHLPPLRKRTDAVEQIRVGHPQPVEQRARVMQADAHTRMPFERRDHRQICLLVMLLVDPAEVADWLVVVENKPEHDLTHTISSRSPQRQTATADATPYRPPRASTVPRRQPGAPHTD